MAISAERINRTSPYEVKQADEYSVFFINKYGVRYSVGFAHDYHFMEEGAYQFYITNIDNKTSPADKNIYITISAIVEDFFANEQAVMIYFCDTKDNRQAMRDRLFQIWFHTYENNVNFSMFNEHVTIDNIIYFASIILRKDHPLHNEVIASFHNFVSTVPDKLNQLQS